MKNIVNKIQQSANNTADIYIYGDIWDSWWSDETNSAICLKDKLLELGDISEINLHINSLGGDVFEGLAMFNLLKQHKATVKVYIDGIAASIASVIAMAGDEIYMPKNSMMMIHNCWTFECGNAKKLRKAADDLDKIMEASIESYMSKINIDRDELMKLLDEETWLTAQECLDKGFCTQILPISDDIEQSASKSIMDLVIEKRNLNMQLKQAEKEISNMEASYCKENTTNISKEAIEEIASRVVEKINENNSNQSNNELKQGSNFMESFFNGILKK